MEQIKLTYEMLLWERWIVNSGGADFPDTELRDALTQSLSHLIKGLEAKTIEIIDLDEITFEDFKAFLKNYPVRTSIDYRTALYYHPRDLVPNYRNLFFYGRTGSSKESQQSVLDPKYSKLLGTLAALFAQIKRDDLLPQMSQNRKIAHLEFLIYDLTFPGLFANWKQEWEARSEKEIQSTLLDIEAKLVSAIPLLNALQEAGVKVKIPAMQVRILNFLLHALRHLAEGDSLFLILDLNERKYPFVFRQVGNLDLLLSKEDAFSKVQITSQVCEVLTQLLNQVVESDWNWGGMFGEYH